MVARLLMPSRGAGGISPILLQKGLGLLLRDRAARNSIRPAVAIADGPASIAAGGLGLGTQAAALPGLSRVQPSVVSGK